MPMSDYMRALRAKLGNDLVLSPSATALIFDDSGRLMVMRHSNRNVWVTPGGAVEPGENPVDSIVREVWEEAALHVEPVELLGVFGGPEFRVEYDNGDVVAYVIAAYRCRVLSGTPKPDGEETLEVRFVTAQELAALDLAPWARTVLPRLMPNSGTPWLPAPTWSPPQA
ncbi:MAG TPA: NUDIX domain-containing protein [Candidatus Binatia bacterium]|nr:NUDIX domain-containing protein [Candidatus Binatia bacterium]